MGTRAVGHRQSSRGYAAKVIQRAWRSYRSHKITTDFAALELDLNRARTLSFEDLTRLLSTDKTTAMTTRLLKGARDGQGDAGAVRIFLSAYLICHNQCRPSATVAINPMNKS